MNYGYSNQKISVVAGRIMQLGIPVRKTVKIIPTQSGRVIKTVTTDDQGHYKVYLPLDNSYLIYAQDENKQFNAVIQDNVVPK